MDGRSNAKAPGCTDMLWQAPSVNLLTPSFGTLSPKEAIFFSNDMFFFSLHSQRTVKYKTLNQCGAFQFSVTIMAKKDARNIHGVISSSRFSVKTELD